MTTRHNQMAYILGFRLQQQLALEDYQISVDTARVRTPTGRTFIPDFVVVPRSLVEQAKRERPTRLESYADPLPLVGEVWSPATGRLDLAEKLPEYQRRGDAEIWFIHPRDRTLTAWVRRPDGSYAEQVHRGGTVHPAALPGVSIDLDELFNL